MTLALKTFVLWERHLTIKSSTRLGHLNKILAQGGGNLNESVFFKCSNARGVEGGGGSGDVKVSN